MIVKEENVLVAMFRNIHCYYLENKNFPDEIILSENQFETLRKQLCHEVFKDDLKFCFNGPNGEFNSIPVFVTKKAL